PTTAEHKLARKNDLKARGILLMALPNEHQLKFNTYKSAKTLMEAIEKRFGGNKESKKVHKTLLKQQYENFNGKSSKGLDQIYDRLTNEAVKIAHGVYAANSKINASTLPNVDSLSDAVIYSFFSRDGLKVADGNADNESKEISQEDRKESRAPKNQDSRNREITRRTMPVEETTSNALVSQYDGFRYDWSDQAKEGPTNFALMSYTSSRAYKAGLESVEARLDVYKRNEAVFKEDIKILKLDIMLRDNALTELRKKF
ncbi:hypothetical protein Tco_1528901, partial [Tanacetum coccineum]